VPSPPPDSQDALRRVWEVYDAAHEELAVELREELLSHPEFGPLVRATPEDPDQEAASHALLRAAMTEDQWEPYFESIRTQAVGYATAEISFESWVELIQMVRRDMIGRLVADAGVREDVWALAGWLDSVMGVFGQAFVDTSEQVIARQQRAIRQLSTPVLQLRDGLLLLPMVGALDTERLYQLRADLLEGIRRRRARVVVLDVTGVPDIDSVVANQLSGTVAAARMMGAAVIVSGLSAEIAQTLVTAGIDLSAVHSVGDLQSGIERAERMLWT
jgi:anti-anti-sigma regulatory factor